MEKNMKLITKATKSINFMSLSILTDLVLMLKLDLLRARIQEYSMMATMMLVCTPKIQTSI